MPTRPTTSLKLDPATRSRLQLLADALAAWADYEATGLHVTGEEVDTWLARLEAGEDVEAPQAHR
jgi:predicted transcriptional regulator